MTDDLAGITRMIVLPLLSRAGKAMKVPLPRNPKKFPTPKKSSPQTMSIDQVHEELHKIELEKLQIANEKIKPKPSSFFQSVSRSSNVIHIKISPINSSPPLGTYFPKYDFLEPKIIGNIQYRKTSLTKSISNQGMNTNIRNLTPSSKPRLQLEECKSQGLFDGYRYQITPKKYSETDRIQINSPKQMVKFRNLTPGIEKSKNNHEDLS